MKIKRKVFINYFLFLLIFLSAYIFSSSVSLFVSGGSRPQGLDNLDNVNSFYTNWIYLIVFVVIVFGISVINGKLYIKKIYNSFLIKYLAFIFLLTIFQIVSGIDFRLQMFTALIVIAMLFYSLWLGFHVSTPATIAKIINFFYFFMFCLSFFLIIYIPSYGLQFNEKYWQGAFDHKNMLGLFCASYMSVFLITIKYRKIVSIINLILSVVLCIGSGSYTSLACLVFSLLLFSLLKVNKSFFSFLRLPLIFVTLTLSILLVYLSITGFSIPIADKDTSFSGRNEIWLYSIVRIFQSPIIGFGYSALGYENSINSAAFFNQTGQVLFSNHNGLIGILYNYGLIGLIGFFYLIFVYYRKAKIVNFSSEYAIFLSANFLLNTFEDRFFGVYITVFVLFLFCCYIDYLIQNLKHSNI